MKKISLKSQRRMQQDAARGKWYNLVELKRVPEFAAWLTDDFHEWQGAVARCRRDSSSVQARHNASRTLRWETYYMQSSCHGAMAHFLVFS